VSTRSAIAIQHGDRIKACYVHFDGYPEFNGRILDTYYRDSVKVNRLVSMGDISALGAEIGDKVEFRSELGETLEGLNSQCIFYNRDRGEETSWMSLEDSAHFVREYRTWGCEYFYLFKNGQWYVRGGRGGWRLLRRVLGGLNKNTAASPPALALNP
jgi:hypothetical protein